jgi:prevent-host-death family protein
MKQTTVRELKHETKKVLAMVEAGETIEVTRNNQPVAILMPTVQKKIEMPDFSARLKAIYGDHVMPTTWVEVMDYDRGDR